MQDTLEQRGTRGVLYASAQHLFTHCARRLLGHARQCVYSHKSWFHSRMRARCFTVHLAVLSSYVCAVASCVPPVKHDDLLADLNAANGFSAFVQGMRARFKASITTA